MNGNRPPRPGKRGVLIQLNGFFEHLLSRINIATLNKIATAQIKIVSIHILCCCTLQDVALNTRAKIELECVDDAAGNFILYRKHIFQLTIIGL